MAAPPTTTIPPFADTGVLPACAINCGPLHGANVACVPPVAAPADGSAYESCYCAHPAVAPLSTGTVGVCDGICVGDDLNSVATWFRDLCTVGDDNNDGNNGGETSTTTQGGAVTTTTTEGSSETSSSGNSGSSNQDNGGGGDWLSNHWQWVVMLVILVVGIAAIWIGACIWRRRYLKKKDRQSTLGQKQSGSASHPSWGPGFSEPSGVLAASPQTEDPAAKGSFMPGATAAALEKGEEKRKSKWLSKSRT